MGLPRAQLAKSDGQGGKPYLNSWVDWASADEWWHKLSHAPRAVLFLDYDGTLAPFERERMQARPYPGVPELLRRFAENPRIRLVFVSGRPAQEQKQLLSADLNVEIWGSHGRERLLANGVYVVAPLNRDQKHALGWLERSLREEGFGVAIEKKPGSLALHMRGQPPSRERELTDLMPELFRQLQETAALDWISFDGGFEVRAVGCSNGDAVRRVLSEEDNSGIVAYLGDDLTDEDAYRALEGHGLRVLVRNEIRTTAADLWLRPPQELIAFLNRWMSEMTPPRRFPFVPRMGPK